MTPAQANNTAASNISQSNRGRTQNIAAFLRTGRFQTNFSQNSLTMDTSNRAKRGMVLLLHSAISGLHRPQIQYILRLMFNDQLKYRPFPRFLHRSRRLSITTYPHTRISHAWLRSKFLRHSHNHHLSSQIPNRNRKAVSILPLRRWFLQTSKLNLLALRAGP